MWNVPSPERLAEIPRLYETEGIPLQQSLSIFISLSEVATGTSVNSTVLIPSGVSPFSSVICSMQSGVTSLSLN